MKNGVIAILITFICQFTHGQAITPNSDCKFFENDPFETGARMSTGPFEGNCIKLDDRRNLKIIDRTDTHITIANFTHEKKFWIAHIPKLKQNIVKTIFIEERFPPEWLAAHTEIRFVFADDSPIILEGQNETNAGETREIHSLIISFEATEAVDGIKYSLIEATKDKFALSARAFSFHRAYDFIVKRWKHTNYQYELNLDEIERHKLMHLLLRRADRNSEQVEMYHTLTNNCTTNVYDALDLIREIPSRPSPKAGQFVGGRKSPKVIPANLLKFLPAKAKKELKRRGMVGQDLENVETEYGRRFGNED